jgi:hypothetical protein
MGLYDLLVKYNITFDELMSIVYDLSKIVYIGSVDRIENIVRDLDDIYDDKEFKKFKKEYGDGI